MSRPVGFLLDADLSNRWRKDIAQSRVRRRCHGYRTGLDRRLRGSGQLIASELKVHHF
jgi:hypothetical protein